MKEGAVRKLAMTTAAVLTMAGCSETRNPDQPAPTASPIVSSTAELGQGPEAKITTRMTPDRLSSDAWTPVYQQGVRHTIGSHLAINQEPQTICDLGAFIAGDPKEDGGVILTAAKSDIDNSEGRHVLLFATTTDGSLDKYAEGLLKSDKLPQDPYTSTKRVAVMESGNEPWCAAIGVETITPDGYTEITVKKTNVVVIANLARMPVGNEKYKKIPVS